ncbi:hypothetical protein CBL_04060 [Carabus blaptoides fortunei]
MAGHWLLRADLKVVKISYNGRQSSESVCWGSPISRRIIRLSQQNAHVKQVVLYTRDSRGDLNVWSLVHICSSAYLNTAVWAMLVQAFTIFVLVHFCKTYSVSEHVRWAAHATRLDVPIPVSNQNRVHVAIHLAVTLCPPSPMVPVSAPHCSLRNLSNTSRQTSDMDRCSFYQPKGIIYSDIHGIREDITASFTLVFTRKNLLLAKTVRHSERLENASWNSIYLNTSS